MGRRLPAKPGDPPERFERREALDSSVLECANLLGIRRALGQPSPDDDPGAGEYGCSLVECWVAEIDRTHLDRAPWRVARRTERHDLARVKSPYRNAE